MEIWLLAVTVTVLLCALGVWGMWRLYGTPGRCDVQSGTATRDRVTAPQILPHDVRLWVDDGGACIDGEVLP